MVPLVVTPLKGSAKPSRSKSADILRKRSATSSARWEKPLRVSREEQSKAPSADAIASRVLAGCARARVTKALTARFMRLNLSQPVLARYAIMKCCHGHVPVLRERNCRQQPLLLDMRARGGSKGRRLRHPDRDSGH